MRAAGEAAGIAAGRISCSILIHILNFKVSGMAGNSGIIVIFVSVT